MVNFDIKTLFIVLGDLAGCIFNLKWQDWFGLRYNPNLLDMKFDILLGASFNLFWAFLDLGLYIDDTLFRNAEKNYPVLEITFSSWRICLCNEKYSLRDELDHLFAYIFTDIGDTLNSELLLTEDKETLFP